MRNIVLMRPINSIIEFKQIIGRGTRLFDGKDYFTIYDFVKAYQHFNDPEWDGEPLEPEEPKTAPAAGARRANEPPRWRGRAGAEPAKLKIKLADGKERTIQHMMATSFWGPDGKPMSAAQFVERLFGELPAFFKSEEELRALWSEPETRRKLLEALSEKGFGDAQLSEIKRMIDAEKSDLYDVLGLHRVCACADHARGARDERARSASTLPYDDEKLRTFLDFVLGEYVKEGVAELDQAKLPQLLALKYRRCERRGAGAWRHSEDSGDVHRVPEVFV